MILILISLVVGAVVVGLLFRYASNEYGGLGFVAALLGAGLSLAVGGGCVAYAFSAWSWFASDYRSQIINREYGTNYTQQEIFWASDVIDTVRELDRKRYEVNGDFRRPTADSKSARDQRSHGADQSK